LRNISETPETRDQRIFQVKATSGQNLVRITQKMDMYGPFVCQDFGLLAYRRQISCQTVTGQHQIPPFMVRKSRTAGTSSGK